MRVIVEDDPCEHCCTEAGSKMYNGLFVCHKCDKSLKKLSRKQEHKKLKQKERENEDY
jgi:ribosomal protein L37AE/L43A